MLRSVASGLRRAVPVVPARPAIQCRLLFGFGGKKDDDGERKMSFVEMMQQAKNAAEQMKQMEETLKSVRAEGQAGNGVVKVTVDGTGEVLEVSIAQAARQHNLLESLVRDAVNDARTKMLEAAVAGLRKGPGGSSMLDMLARK